MPNIQVLDSHVADLIAAGEVVERPASVAKELMENAIDAGACKVTVEISHGGLTFLRVTDDGKGIPAGELPTAFLRHATSKLRRASDLEAIGTLGFRGEALAAIAAVSQVEVMTRTADSPLGASLSLEGGVAGPVEEAGCPLGTTMVVRDLFYNTPARLKFMKKDTAEGAAVFAAVQRTALSHPEVSVKFIRDGKQELLTPGDGQLQSAVYAVLGRELALGLKEVKGSGEDMSVTGFVSQPVCCRASRNWQFFFVNGRQVKSRLMMAALEEAYRNQRMVGKFPACVLHLQLRPSAVDVNVHPAKTEVKFGAERQVFSAVYHAVLSALEGDRSRPALELDTPRQQRIPQAAPAREKLDQLTLLQSVPPRRMGGTSLPLSDAARPAPRPQMPVHRVVENSVEKVEKPQGHVSAPPASHKIVTEIPRISQESTSFPPPPASAEPPAPAAAEKPQAPILEAVLAPAPAPISREASPAPAEAPVAEIPVEAPVEEPAPWRVAGEVLNTYIVVEQEDRVLLIDKHAAHERILFEKLKANQERISAQELMQPVPVRLSPTAAAELLANGEMLEELGFALEEFGENTLLLRQIPMDLSPEDAAEAVEALAADLLSGRREHKDTVRDELLHTVACKAAIKAGWKNDEKELLVLAEAVMAREDLKYCPHGRPICVSLSKKQLEKQFRRA